MKSNRKSKTRVYIEGDFLIKDFEMAIRVVSAWFAQHLYKLQEYETGFVHGGPHTGNIIIDKKGRKIVLIDALCRSARPENIWLDVLLFTVSISKRTGPTQTGNLQQMLHRDIIKDNPVLENRKLLLRQAMVLGRFFLFADRGVRETARAFRSLMVGVKNFMRLLSPSTRK